MPSATTTDGLLLIDKPAGATSHDVVAVARRSLGVARIGHAGTLDPFATGLLVLLLGRGTRLLPFMEGEPKTYDAVIQFGAETDTDDATGETVRRAELPNRKAVAAAIERLTGTFDQMPPAFSAKKVQGRRAYAAARKGQSVDLKPATVTVRSWTVLSATDDHLRAASDCSSGTYIRALARDLGRLSQSAAHLSAVRRLRSGPFTIEEAQSLDDLRAGVARIHGLGSGIPSMPRQRVDEDQIRRLTRGQPIEASGEAPRVALVDGEDALVAIGERSGDALRPVLVLRDA